MSVMGLLVLGTALAIWGLNRAAAVPDNPVFLEPVPDLSALLPDEDITQGDFEEMFGHIPPEQREEFRRQRLMVKYVFSNPEYMRTGKIPPKIQALLRSRLR